MNSTLTPQLRDELRQSFIQPGFSAEAEVQKLVSNGYDTATAKSLIVAEFRAYKNEKFKEVDRQNQSEEAKKVAPLIVLMISAIGPIFEVSSMIWYIIAIAVAGVTGYWAYRPKPIAGLVACIIIPFVFPLAYNFYFAGRTSYIKIEMVIPMLIAAAPAAIVYYIISKTVYANVEN
ncbi:hypothetical protein D3H65_06330 [Paraflavitalea soli]|uniref:Uncharacterized protein n=1 Tax=Paraflavitalea soli TaxID=2315862 RepID=A0A3B7MSY6_9BACT|nr:hypothetical protein [Paraflavitalea soli]AXY73621.1 hypothetical protein D3H65_06330 [Paraflavitalea soli]